MSNIPLIFEGKLKIKKSGRLSVTIGEPTILYRGLKRLNGKELKIVITEKKRRRTLKQQAMYWAAVVGQAQRFWSDSEGYEVPKDIIHEYHMTKVLGLIPTEHTIGDLKLRRYVVDKSNIDDIADRLEFNFSDQVGKSSTFNTKYYSLLIEKCIKHYAETFDFMITLKPNS